MSAACKWSRDSGSIPAFNRACPKYISVDFHDCQPRNWRKLINSKHRFYNQRSRDTSGEPDPLRFFFKYGTRAKFQHYFWRFHRQPHSEGYACIKSTWDQPHHRHCDRRRRGFDAQQLSGYSNQYASHYCQTLQCVDKCPHPIVRFSHFNWGSGNAGQQLGF